MAETKGPYKRVSLQEATTDEQLREDLSALDQPWQPERARFRIASGLACSLLAIFALAVACNGVVIMALVITNTISAAISERSIDPATGVEPMLAFVKTLLPYIATPLGIAFGYFFRDSQTEG